MATQDDNGSRLVYALWFMWKAINDAVFNDRNPNPMQIILQTQSHVTEFLQSTTNVSQATEGNVNIKRDTH